MTASPTLDAAPTGTHAQAAPPIAGDETSTLLGALERQRATFAWKCGDLDDEALAMTLGRSQITLGGLLKHLAFIEDEVFTTALLGRPLPAPWDRVDWEGAHDWEWHSAAADTPERLYGLWQQAVRRSRAATQTALKLGGIEMTADVVLPDGQPTLRRLLIDMIEEYARHNGHADLIRESIDGLVGEEPPVVVPAWPPLD